MSKCTCEGLVPCDCRKVELRIECYTCGYPSSESRYFDAEEPLDCDAPYEELLKHIKATK